MSDDTTEVAILGGGVIGSAIAYFLSKGGVQTLVLERSEIAAESSSAAGLLSLLGNVHGPGALTDLLLASNTLIRDLMPELEALSGESMEYRRWGSLHTASDEQEAAHLCAQMDAWGCASYLGHPF
ncbi:MAG TPA: FAD-dependent oxidoreductase [Ktedonobacteraceae bacterium]